MSRTGAAPAAALAARPARPGRGGRRGRRGRVRLAAAALVVALVLVVGSLLSGGRSDAPLDPANPGPGGAQAVARVLEQRGTPVDVVRSRSALETTDVAGAVVAVTGVAGLGPTTERALRDHARPAAAVVYVGPGEVLAETVREDASGLAPRRAGDVAADCDEPLVTGLEASLARGADLGAGGGSCFGGALERADRDGTPTWLLAAPEVVANGTVRDADNAAVALRLLEQGDEVVWYVPDPADVPVEEAPALTDFLPDGLVPGLWLAAVAGVTALVWRGRRLGPLAVEPLPVVVRAAESTHARGRMYHRTRDRAHAAAVLREATRARLARQLRLPADAAPRDVAEATAARTGGDPHRTWTLLTDPPPTSDAGLADLGRRLRALEDEVHRS